MPPRTHTLTLWQDPKSGNYCAIAYFPATEGEDRDSVRRSLGTKDEEEAIARLPHWDDNILPQILADRRAKSNGKRSDDNPRLDAMAAWYRDVHLVATEASDKTISNYNTQTAKFVAYMSGRRIGRLNQLTSRNIQDWQVSDEGCNRDALLTVRRWLSEYRRMHATAEMPDLEWNIPKKKKSSRYKVIPRKDLAAFVQRLEETRSKIYPHVAWIVNTGWLISDVLDFRWDEIKGSYIDRERLKTRNQILYPITPELQAILDLMPHEGTHVFPMLYKTFYNRLHAFQKREDFPAYTMRDLRVSFATHLADDGCPSHILAELMGHSDPTVVLKYYVKLNAESLRSWANKVKY